jgi:hypothetical protein
LGGLFKIILKPFTRLILGLIAIPFFRFILKRVFRQQSLEQELGKDLEEWFRGALLLLAATANMEHLLFGWIQRLDWLDSADWFTMGLRLMLAIGVIEAMPDQELFAVMYPGPPKLHKEGNLFQQVWKQKLAFLKGFVCRHLNRSSPVLAMMCAIVGSPLPAVELFRDHAQADHLEPGRFYVEDIERHDFVICWSYCQQFGTATPIQCVVSADQVARVIPEITAMTRDFDRCRERWMVGWVCYLLAITQYLVIGLVTRRDKALDMLSEFDRAIAERRKELVEEFVEEGSLPEDFAVAAPVPDEPKAEESGEKPVP